MRLTPLPRFAAVLSLALVPAGCGTLENGRGWGQDATLWPRVTTVERALSNALLDPWTWGPALGALAFSIDDWDQEVSDWAKEETPIFGSRSSARDASDITRNLLLASSIAASLSTDSGPTPGVWLPSKAKGIGVSAIGIVVTDRIVSDLKDTTARVRPNGGERSMPSTHAAQAFASAAWTVRTVDSIDISDRARHSWKFAARSLAIATAWARVEGEMHYPSDVLVGATIGNFFTRFAHDAFLGLPGDPVLSASVDPGGDGVMIGISWGF